MIDNRKFLRFFIWCAVLLFLMATWLYVWTKKTEPEAVKTAFLIAQKQILTNANNYKQHWLVNKQSSNINGVNISFTSNGWPIIFKNGEVDCEKWLTLLWPDKKIFGQNYAISEVNQSHQEVSCKYMFENDYFIYLQLVNGGFGVNIENE